MRATAGGRGGRHGAPSPAGIRTRPVVVARSGGIGALGRLVAAAAPHRRDPRVLVLTGGHLSERPWAADLRSVLSGIGRHTMRDHRGVPTPDSVAALARFLRAEGVDVLVAVGGGAVLDAGKAAAALAGEDPVDASTVTAACSAPAGARGARPRSHGTVRVVAVPTTPGTGAETTPFATVWDLAGQRKLSLAGPDVLPSAAVLDPRLLAGLPRAVLASGVLDTLCQGAEAAWSVRSTPRSRAFAFRAVELVADRGGGMLASPLDGREALALQLAGHSSGRAIALAGTNACHAVSYPLTLHHGLAHGHACGVSLGRLLVFNAGVRREDCADPRGPAAVRRTVARLARTLGGTPAQAAARLEGLLAHAELAGLGDLPLDAEAVAREAATYPRCRDNPRRLDGRLAGLLAAPVHGGRACA